MTFNPNSYRDNDRKAFDDDPNGLDQKTVRRVKIVQGSGDTVVIDVDGLSISDCGDAQVNDGACDSAATVRKTINNEELAAVGVTRIVGSKSILIQPLNGDINFGHTSGNLYHVLTEGNFYEFQGKHDIDLFIKSASGNVKVAISEFK